MMKKYILFFTTLAVLFTGCSSKDDPVPSTIDNPYQYDEKKVFKKSEIIGTWDRIAFYDISGKNWINYSCDQGKGYMQLSENGVSDFYDACRLDKIKPGTWTFDDKNRFEVSFSYEQSMGEKFTSSFNLINVSADELIVEETDHFFSGIFKFKKTTLTLNDYYQRYTYGCKVKDTTSLKPYWYEEKEDKAYLIGTRNEKLWIGVFDTNSKDQLFEATDSEKFDWTKRVHIGYGEYKNYLINKISVNEIFEDNKLIRLTYFDNENYVSFYTIWFTESNNKYDLRYYNSPVIPWHSQSILADIIDENITDGRTYTCFSEKGDKIFNGYSNHFYAPESFPVDYYDFVRFNQTHGYNNDNILVPYIEVYLSSLNKDDFNYAKEIKQLFYPKSHDYKMDITLLNQNGNIWTFKIDITEYSGEKHSHTVDIDINAEDTE